MSALGQKQTFRDAKAVSALPPKADMCGATTNVRFGANSGHPSRRHKRPRPMPASAKVAARSRSGGSPLRDRTIQCVLSQTASVLQTFEVGPWSNRWLIADNDRPSLLQKWR